MKSKRTKACEIPRKVKVEVYARDNECCVLCGKWVPLFFANAHFIPRSQGGLGIPENIFTACQECHDRYDKTVERKAIRERLLAYLIGKYLDFDEKELYYDKRRAYEANS